MKEIRLKKLSLRNFKGIREFDLDIDGQGANVLGQNASGKTSLMDAWLFLLFNKDSQGQTNFEIKTLDESGEPLHNLEHTVEAVLAVDGEEITLKKTYAEKYTKKRGSARETFTGHETKYWINGVPCKKNEFEATVGEIVDEGTFRLLTDPKQFNNLHWEKQRKLLFAVCGNASDEEIVKIEDKRKVVKAKQAEINKELKEIPARISTAQDLQPDIGDLSPEGIQTNLKVLREHLQKKQDELSQIQSGGGVAEKTKKLREVEGELQEIKNRHYADVNKQVQAKTEILTDQRTMLLTRKGDLGVTAARLGGIDAEIPALESKVKTLRDDWHEIDREQLAFTPEQVCPACGQDLPAEKLAEARDKAEAEFNASKAKKLEDIRAEGMRLADRLNSLKKEKAEIEQFLVKGKTELEEREAEIAKTEAEIETIKASATDVSENPTYQAKLQEKEAIEAQIAELKLGNETAIAEVRKDIAAIQEDIEDQEHKQAELESAEKGKKLIKELKGQEKNLAKEYERLESELFEVEEAIRAKAGELEDMIAAKFKLVRFRLFDTQINEGIKETCVATLGGVPYSDLNSAGKVQAGLDIIETLQGFHGISCPIWLDNRESVVHIPEMDCQVISLIVSAGDKALRVETKEMAVV